MLQCDSFSPSHSYILFGDFRISRADREAGLSLEADRVHVSLVFREGNIDGFDVVRQLGFERAVLGLLTLPVAHSKNKVFDIRTEIKFAHDLDRVQVGELSACHQLECFHCRHQCSTI